MPDTAAKMWSQLGVEEKLDSQRLPQAATWGGLNPGAKVSKAAPLFPRIE